MNETTLTSEELLRYDRHLLLPNVGREGQARLKRARVLVAGAGGLGSPAALYLAAAGVGTLGIMDADRVDVSNLQRQILHGSGDIGREKTLSAKARLKELNPNTRVEVIEQRLDAENAAGIVSGFDAVLGCVDNFVARYAINAACVELGRPNIFASVAGFDGQASVFSLNGGPCYRCFFQEPPPPDWSPSPAEKAVLSPLPGLLGCIQAAECLKVLLGAGDSLSGRLLLVNGLAMKFREVKIARDPECPVCGGQAWKKETT